MDFSSWTPRGLADATAMNARVRDVHRQLASPPRFFAAGVSTITSVPDTGVFKTLKWDVIDAAGGWTTTADTFTVPTSGTYFITADFTALSPKDTSKRPALRLAVVAQTGQVEKDWLRSTHPIVVGGTYLTCSVRGPVVAAKGDRLSLRALAAPGTGAWEVSAGSRASGQLNRFSAVLIAPGTSR
ncbi:hypothetical protein [Streptomyces sp. UNOB3_S3]|uniref:hypothetical protein n=1 Tax=Streptomyces sp. UNOB3_S3 TaxID=2871682 RepID=UPI001E369E9F|nr:hypothetical protein [Streptomyces sp. UNOB3_S3]MCC3773662.1 hypothetical protein [Streptomyces sp. UNOB3_S3]